MSDKVISRAEAATHNTDKSIWIVINNKVYDVTEFADQHPGGGNVLRSFAGNKIQQQE